MSALKFLRYSTSRQLTIVTASDSSHFKSLLNLLTSIQRHEPLCHVSFWDLGLKDQEKVFLSQKFPEIELNTFDFSKYPSHFNLSKNAGEFAWKPVIIELVFRRNTGTILWLDAGDFLTTNANWLKRFVQKNGFFSSFSNGTISDWTHPSMLKQFAVDPAYLNRKNLNGAVIAFDTNYVSARNLLNQWVECAMEKKCIAPDNSNRTNHRQDQAALTVLAYKEKMAPEGFYADNSAFFGIKIHQDID